MPRPKGFLKGLIALALVLVAHSAVAQVSPSSDAEAEARAAMKRGLAAFARRDAETALAEYRKAERLVPDANLPHRYAAEALVELQRYEEAVQEYETYLRIKPDVSDAAEIRQRMETARASIDGSIDLTSSPPGASVFVDGSPTQAGITPLTGLRIKGGLHTIVLKLPGKRDVVLSPVVRGGEALALAANFADASPPNLAAPDPLRPPQAPSTRATIGWIMVAAGGAALGTALVIDAFLLPSAFDTFEEKRRRDDPTAGEALSDAEHLQVGAIIVYATGAALAATGAVLVLWPRKTNAPLKGSLGVGGAFLTGTF